MSSVRGLFSARPSSDALAITQSGVALCSTPCKVLRFAPTPLSRGLRTLTASPRSSRTGSYVMAAETLHRPTPLTNDVVEVDDGFAWRYSAVHFADATRHPLHVARCEALIDRRPQVTVDNPDSDNVFCPTSHHVCLVDPEDAGRTRSATMAIAARLAINR